MNHFVLSTWDFGEIVELRLTVLVIENRDDLVDFDANIHL
jgi:hypothetical protein